jgi:hypothetical protein
MLFMQKAGSGGGGTGEINITAGNNITIQVRVLR